MANPKALQPVKTLRQLDTSTRRFNRSLAAVARAAVPAEIMMEYLLAILEGHGGAILVRDPEAEGGWVVGWPELEPVATPQEKQWAWTQWRQAGFGMPVQEHILDGQLARQAKDNDSTIQVTKGLAPAQLIALRRILEGRAEAEAQDAEALQPASEDDAADADDLDANAIDVDPVAGADHSPGDPGQPASLNVIRGGQPAPVTRE